MIARAAVRAYIALGSNLDNPQQQIRDAIAAIAQFRNTHLLCTSRFYHSAPWGKVDQPDFVNAVVAVETSLTPHQLLDALLALEQAQGRTRTSERWGPRVLDLDLLVYGTLVLQEAGLTLPHPRLHERAFVLLPLADCAPDLDIPGRGRVNELLHSMSTHDCFVLEETSTA